MNCRNRIVDVETGGRRHEVTKSANALPENRCLWDDRDLALLRHTVRHISHAHKREKLLLRSQAIICSWSVYGHVGAS